MRLLGLGIEIPDFIDLDLNFGSMDEFAFALLTEAGDPLYTEDDNLIEID